MSADSIQIQELHWHLKHLLNSSESDWRPCSCRLPVTFLYDSLSHIEKLVPIVLTQTHCVKFILDTMSTKLVLVFAQNVKRREKYSS